MPEWLKSVVERLQVLEGWGYFTLAANAVIFLAAPWLAAHYGNIKDKASQNTRLRTLHGFNFIVFATFLLAVIIKVPLPKAEEFSQTCLLVLVTYLLIHLAEVLLLRRYGREISVEDYSRRVETQTSKTLELVAFTIIIIIAGVALIQIWGVEHLLQTTSVLGVIAVLFFFTREHWVGDMLGGIMIISSGRLERGDVVSIPGENIIGIVLQTRGLHTIIRDLARGHDIILPNSALLKQRVDTLKTDLQRGVRDYVEFRLGYDAPADKARQFLQATWQAACERTTAIDAERGCRVTLKDCGDHGATWRLAYTPKQIHAILVCQDTLREAAYRLQETHGIPVSTPLTHQHVETSARPKEKSSAMKKPVKNPPAKTS
jgi:small-conductance mechanosensitive channel